MSSLASQVNRLAAARGQKKPRATASILFSAADASEIDGQALLELARSSLQELVAFDQRLAVFDSLFAQSSSSLDRTLLSADENARLDRSLNKFLRVLAPWFSSKAAHRIVEYLVRTYQVHSLNVDALMECSMAFQDTEPFLRLLRIMAIEGSKWAFLGSFRQGAVPPSRHAIADRVAHDPSVLNFYGNTIRHILALVPPQDYAERLMSWFAATMFAAIELHSPSEELVRAICSQSLHGLSFTTSPSVPVRYIYILSDEF
jgi:U3 small nucleolar RNA-associated protein 10